MRKLAAGNWKMNGTLTDLVEMEALAPALTGPAEVLICPPATLIQMAAGRVPGLQIGAQDCHAAAKGAHTGDLSAAMLRDAGASHVILGHSERREDHGETNAAVHAKMLAAWDAGLTAILCIGESLTQREAGETLDHLARQVADSLPDGATADNTVIAYEPIWAIGTGLVPSMDQIAEVHAALRAGLITRFGAETANAIRLLYGGSVKAANATEIFAVPHVDGALVGGASLKAADFSGIVKALHDSAA